MIDLLVVMMKFGMMQFGMIYQANKSGTPGHMTYYSDSDSRASM